jgi:hypothetical protein
LSRAGARPAKNVHLYPCWTGVRLQEVGLAEQQDFPHSGGTIGTAGKIRKPPTVEPGACAVFSESIQDHAIVSWPPP